MDGKPIEFVKSYSHLGHIINACMDDSDDICHRRGTFIGQVNNVLCYFSALNSPTKYRLFQSYCTSFYSCELWRLSDIGVLDFCTAWRKLLAEMTNSYRQTHTQHAHQGFGELLVCLRRLILRQCYEFVMSFVISLFIRRLATGEL